MWVLRWFASLIGALALVYGVVEGYDQLSSGAVATWLAKQESWLPSTITLTALYFTVPTLFFFVLAVPVVLIRRRTSSWKAWCHTFLYAGSADRLNLAVLVPRQRMDLRYVPLKRSLQHSLTLGRPPIGSSQVADDAAAYLLSMVSRPDWQESHWGFLLEGTAVVGKTRFCGEWLRKHRPKAFLLFPLHNSLSRPHPRLRRYTRKGVVLFLDNLDNYEPIIENLCWFVGTLHEWRTPVLVVATVRDSGPGQQVQTDSVFRPLRDRLAHFALTPLSDTQMEQVGKELNEPPPTLTQDRSPTFAWLLRQQFDEMRRRFNILLSERDRSLLRTARLLDICGIPVSRERWLRVAQRVLNFPREPSIQVDTFTSLRRHGFLTGESPEPSYLKHVINGEFDINPLLTRLAESLRQDKDGEGFFYWGTSMTRQGVDRDAASVLLGEAVTILAARGTPEGQAATAQAAFNLGRNLDEAGKREEAHQAYGEAMALGKASGMASGQDVAASAAFNLGQNLDREGKREEANQIYRQAVALGKTSERQRGLAVATVSACYLGQNLAAMDKWEEGNQVWLEAIELGKAGGIPEGKENAAQAAFMLGQHLDKAGKREEAHQAYGEAMALGKASRTSLGQRAAAEAGVNLGSKLARLGQGKEANRVWREAVDLGKASETPQGLEAAAQAAFNLGVMLHQSDREEAHQAYREAVALGHASGTPLGVQLALQAIVNLRGSAHDEGADWAYREVIALGKTSGTAPGLQAGARAAVNLGTSLDKKGKAEEANHAWREAVVLGQRSETPAGQQAAAQAAFYLGVNLALAGKGEDANLSYQQAIVLGKASGMAWGQEAAAQAAFNLGVYLSRAGKEEEAHWAWQEAMEVGKASGRPLGQDAAARAAFNLGFNQRLNSM